MWSINNWNGGSSQGADHFIKLKVCKQIYEEEKLPQNTLVLQEKNC